MTPVTVLNVLGEWAVRASALAALAGALLCGLRVRDVSFRLATWTAVIFGALLIPMVHESAPGLPLVVRHSTPARHESPQIAAPAPYETPLPNSQLPTVKRPLQSLDWPAVSVWVWAVISTLMLLRLGMGLWLSQRLLRGRAEVRPGVFESPDVTVPVTLGVFRPVILLPSDWREWPTRKLAAVLTHESSHIERHDPFRQLAASVYRAICWFHPLAWWLHKQTAELAEAASDDAALRSIPDGSFYAETLVEFWERMPQRVLWEGVGMTRRCGATRRLDRILDSSRQLSVPLRRGTLAGLTIAALFFGYVAAAAYPQSVARPASPAAAVAPARAETPAAPAAAAAQAPTRPGRPQQPRVVPKAAAENPPLSVVLVVDRSGSMRSNGYMIDTAITALTTSANPADEFLLVTFNSAVDVAGPFTNAGGEILQQLHRDNPRGGTSLRDAILRAIQWSGARYPNRRLIVISDGDDNSSSITADQLQDAVIPARVPVWAITLAAPRVHPRLNLRWLGDLATRTQGREFLTNDPDDVAAIAGQLLRAAQ